jgi:para-nitrobenzyl esterase
MSLASVGRRLLLALAAAVAVCAPAVHLPAHAQSAPIVRTATGDVQGMTEHGVLAFKGIPFAAPPIGNLRWRKPNPAAAWQGVRSGDAFASGCVAVPGIPADFGGETGPQNEDCLYLNVWTPKAEAGARLPVMVWIHGGAFVFGSGGVQLYSGAPLAKKGAVVVAVNYRLLQLGFFAHPALEREQPGGPVNFGLFDQVAALKWVQQNIAAFGGDPGNVTIFGQSAGAKSVLALFASPMARGLFHKGIAQSSYIVPEATRAKAREAGIKTADGLGLPGPRATAAELRAVPAEKFAQLKGKGFSTSPVAAWGDAVLPQSIQATFAAGRQAALPLIVGNTSDDISVAAAFGIDTSALLKRLGGAGFLVRALYPGVRDTSEVARLAAGDVVFTMPVRWLADRHAQRAPVWRYYFDYVTVKNRPQYPNGVQHGGEVPYVLGTLDIFDATKAIATDKDREVARQLSTYWFEFARTGRPSADGAPAWLSHRARQDRTLVVEDEIEVQKNFMGPRLRILLGVSRVVGKVLGSK